MKNLKITLRSKKILVFFILIISLYLIFFLFFYVPTSKYNGNETTITGKILDFKITDDTLKLTIKGQEKIVGYYTIKNAEEKNNIIQTLGYHNQVSLVGKMTIPQENDIPNVFSYKKYLEKKYIHFLFYANKIKITATNNLLYKFKNKCWQRILKIKDNAYIKAFILGITDDIDKDLFITNGISHLFAISGMHFSILAFFLNKLFRKRKYSNFGLLFFLWLYAFLASFTPGVLRTVLFITIKTCSKKLKLSNLKILGIVFLFLLLINPFYLYDVGFLYSFLISFGLLLYAQKKKAKKPTFFSISAYCFFLSLPITAMLNYKVNILAIFLSPFASFYVTFFLYPLALLTFLFPPLSFIFQIFFQPFLWFNKIMSQIKIGNIILPKCYFGCWLIYFYLYFKTCFYFNKKYSIFLAFYLLIIIIFPKFDSHAYVTFLSIGQGDCTLLISPYQKEVLLIDTGGENKPEKGKSITASNIITYLHSKGIWKINTLILTHGDADHAKNTLDLLKDIPINKIYLNLNKLNSLEQEILKEHAVFKFSNLDNSFFKIQNLNFSKVADENEASLVLKIKFFQYQVLIMGDAPSSVEKKLLSQDISATILKVGHHGSKTSSDYTFLQKVSPSYAIISAGKNNIYHHPSPETLAKLQKLKIPYYITSQNHTIIFQFQKNNYHIYPMFDKIEEEKG